MSRGDSRPGRNRDGRTGRAGDRARGGRRGAELPGPSNARRPRAQRLLAPALLVAVALAVAYVTTQGSSPPGQRHTLAGAGGRPAGSQSGSAGSLPATTRYAVGLRVMRFVDHTRSITLPSGATEPRTIVTYVRYPAAGPDQQRGDVAKAPPAHGPFPLIVFGHGFALTPRLYAPLLRAWTSAGYVVAAPVFPLENAHAPGGPNESDLPNQPADMRLVISRLLAANASTGPLHGLIDPRAVAVAGHSDGGDTALAVAYDPRYRDPRVDAAMILSGAEIPGLGTFSFPAGSPPLLATQGTADTVNPPSATMTFFRSAPAPKYLLLLTGAGHLRPYSIPGPQLDTVERVTLAFLGHYLRHAPRRRLLSAGNVPGVARLEAHP